MTDGFRNRHERFIYLVACETAARVLDDPTTIDAGKAHLAKFAANDPRQRNGYLLWTALLDQGAAAVAAALLDRSEQGDYARQTAPSFGGLPAALRANLIRLARNPLPPNPNERAKEDPCPAR